MPRKPKAPPLTAKTADKHILYEKSVQCPEADVAFMDRVYRRTYGRYPVSLREDFCGTASLCAEWVKSRNAREAVGVDLDPLVLRWGQSRNVAPLGEQAARVELVQADVRDPGRRVDVRVAFNFSYWVFKQRPELVGYFRAAREGLSPEGLFGLDMFGGPEAQTLTEESREIDGFEYVWHQERFNPIDHDYLCHIHFDFRDGSRLEKAFTYDWRLWGMMEVRDALAEAGFSRSEVYWEGADPKTHEGTGVFRKRTRVKNEDCWVAYLVAFP